MTPRWLDLSDHRLAMRLYMAPSGKQYIVVQGQDVLKFEPVLSKLGFTARSKADNPVLHRELQPEDAVEAIATSAGLRKAFPEAKIVDFNAVLHAINGQTAAAPATSVPPASAGARAPVLKGVPIGRNRLGHEVFTGEEGRWVRDERGVVSLESETSPPNPGLFLRAADDAALAACADGFVEMAARNRISRAADFESFVATIYEGRNVTEADHARVRGEIEVAVARFLAKKGGKSLREAFIASGKLTDSLAFLTDGRSARLTGPVGPMGIAAQRILGTEIALRDQTIVVAAANPAGLVNRLPSTAKTTVVVPAASGVAGVQGVLTLAGAKDAVVKVTAAPELGGAHAIVLDQVAARPKKAVRASGQEFTRADFAAVLTALEARDADGVSVFFLDAPNGASEHGELEALRNALAAGYSFEGEAHVNAALWRGLVEESPRIMLSIGPRLAKSEPEALPAPVYPIDDWSSLWTWTAEVVTARARAEVKPVDADVSLNAADASLARNSYQTPYVSASRIGTPSTMVPRNLEAATRAALTNISRIYGDIDAFVAKEYGYELHEIAEIFSPEQVDGLALHAHAERRERGFLFADNTGVGKGRALAAVMRRAVLKGQIATFITEREPNLSDIWRDIMATRSADLFRPLVVNADAKIIDRNTKEILLRGADKAVIDAMIASDEIPEGVNLIMATYSQFNRDTSAESSSSTGRDPAAKSKWFTRAIGKRVKLVLDESHNASGDSNVSENITVAVERAGGVAYSSATFAASADRMAFYAPLFPDDLSTAELSTMMSKGGETFQEVLSGMLVHDGVMIRREFDLSKVTFETVVDTARFDRNRGLMDAIAPVIAEMATLSGDMDRRIIALNGAARAQAQEAAQQAVQEAPNAPAAGDNLPAVQAQAVEPAADRRVKTMNITRVGFGSPLYTISRLFVAALRVDIVVEDALDLLQKNEKPVILVENTMQQLLEELAATENGDEPVAVDFRALFRRTLRMMVTTSWRENGKIHRRDISESDPNLGAKVARIQAMIDELPDIPVNVIDEVKRRIQEAGYTIDEITGRTLEVRDGRIMRRPPTNPTMVKNDFNDGVLDAVLINTAGATGIDLHASSTFPDQRRRNLLELQPPQDIVRKMQARGRINRYDQVVDPKVRAYVSGLPIEMRLNAMENARLRRLSANTTSNRDAAQLTRDVPDLINPVGDVVCARYAEARPDLMRRLGFKVGDIELAVKENATTDRQNEEGLAEGVKTGVKSRRALDEVFKVSDTKRTANEILSRLIMLPVDLQTRVCNELTAEFHAAIEEMEARGETPLRVHEISGIVHERDMSVFDGANAEQPDSVFHEPLYLMNAALERTAQPIRSDDLAQRIEIGELASGRAQPCIDRIRNGMEEILSPYLPDGFANVADAIARGAGEVRARRDRLERLVQTLEEVRPGREISYSVDDEVVKGIITRVDFPNRGYEHVPGLYGVEFAVPGDESPRSMRIETLLKDPKFTVGEGLEAANYDAILKRFDDAVMAKLTPIRLLTHNIYRAMRMNVEHRLGTLVTYRTPDGVVHRAVTVSGRHRNLAKLPVEVASPEMAYEAIANGVELSADKDLGDKSFSIKLADEGGVELRLPPRLSRKYGHIYDNPEIVEMQRRGEHQGKSGYKVLLRREELREVLQALHHAGAKFWASPVHRKWSLEWMMERHSPNGPGEAAALAPAF